LFVKFSNFWFGLVWLLLLKLGKKSKFNLEEEDEEDGFGLI